MNQIPSHAADRKSVLTNSTGKLPIKRPRVLVLLASCNGEDFIEEQVRSILAQDDVDVTIWISDDASTDQTLRICQNLNDPRIHVTQNLQNMGVAANFMHMIYRSDSRSYDYFALSDQDDVWLPWKLSRATQKLQLAGDRPCLYYSDITNTDCNLKGGVNEFQNYQPYSQNIKSLLLFNWAAGCSMVMNGKMLDLLQYHQITYFPRIHDAWIHLVALSCATTIPDLEISGILRRITGQNQVGQHRHGEISKSRMSEMIRHVFTHSDNGASQTASTLITGYSSMMDQKTYETLACFARQNSSIFKRIRLVLDHDYRIPSTLETLIIKIRILLGRL